MECTRGQKCSITTKTTTPPVCNCCKLGGVVSINGRCNCRNFGYSCSGGNLCEWMNGGYGPNGCNPSSTTTILSTTCDESDCTVGVPWDNEDYPCYCSSDSKCSLGEVCNMGKCIAPLEDCVVNSVVIHHMFFFLTHLPLRVCLMF